MNAHYFCVILVKRNKREVNTVKLRKVAIKNFRAYSERVEFSVDEITAIIGKNDIGKSTILDALDVFFNNNKMEIADRNIHCGDEPVEISCMFSDFPAEIILDETVATTLANEYLLNEDGLFEVRKNYSCSGKETVHIIALHPSNDTYNDLLTKKNSELKTLIRSAGLQDTVNLTINSEMRHSLWQSLGEALNLSTQSLSVDKEEAKNIWQKLIHHLPQYHVFRSDRPSTDEDALAQDPMQIAMKAAIQEKQEELTRIAEEIKERVSIVADHTIEKLKEFDDDLASTLKPQFKKEPSWEKAFSFSLSGDDDIPINKRGSGVRRLILFSFFRAKCESDMHEDSNVIYAVEEPETSQHPDFQQNIINTFIQMCENPNCQIIFTTHVPGLAKLIPISSLRYLTIDSGHPTIEENSEDIIAKIADSLGVLPNLTPSMSEYRTIDLIVCVEGVNDIKFLENISSVLHDEFPEIKKLSDIPNIIVLPMGGSSLQEWVNCNYLRKLNIPEYHIYDSDCTYSHQTECDEINGRNNGSSARMTSKREMENYLHTDAIKRVYSWFDCQITDELDVPKTISNYLREHNLPGCKEKNVKLKLNGEAAKFMSLDLLKQQDTQNEVLSWICDIQSLDINEYL